MDPTRPVTPTSAITTFIFKVASRCNLACTYCYMYNGADQSWRSLPVFMDLDVAEAALRDIADYATARGLTSVSVVLHGGEPLLLSADKLQAFLDLSETVLGKAGIALNLSVQTNATVANRRTLELLLSRGVAIGVSLDLSDEAHDRTRVDKMGRGTSARVHEGIQAIRRISGGREPQSALFVIDPEVSPIAAYERLESLGFPFVDVLLPDENWETATPDELAARFGSWLTEFFRLYCHVPRTFRVRWFSTALKLAAGGVWGSDMLGLNSSGTLIVETDGTYHFHDVLRTAGEEINNTYQRAGAGSSGICAIESASTMVTMMDKQASLSPTCLSCGVVGICGGGHIAHRYSNDRQFQNPSIYCEAVLPLYEAILERVNVANVAAAS